MPKMTLKMEKGKVDLSGIEEFWEEIREHMKNPAYARTAKFAHKCLAGKA